MVGIDGAKLVSTELLHDAGFDSRKDARQSLYKKTRVCQGPFEFVKTDIRMSSTCMILITKAIVSQ